MNSSNGVASRTRSQTRFSNGVTGVTENDCSINNQSRMNLRNDEVDMEGMGETSIGKNDIPEENEFDSSPSHTESGGYDVHVAFLFECILRNANESESLEQECSKCHGENTGNCNGTMSSNEIVIERITEDEFTNRKAFDGSKDSSIGRIRKGEFSNEVKTERIIIKDEFSNEIEIERITEDEFRNRKAFCGSNDSSKGEFKKTKIHHSLEDIKIERISEAEIRKSKRRHTLDDDVIERISEAEFKNSKTHHYPKEFLNERISKAECRNSDESMMKSGFRNNAIDIELISESEFRNSHHRSNESSSGKGFSGCCAEKDPRCERRTAESDKYINKESAFAHTGMIGRSGSGYDDSYVVSISSDSNSQLEGKDGMRSHRLCDETNLGIASRTRLKTGYAKKPLKAKNISTDVLDGSLSSCDSGFVDPLSSNDTGFDYTDDEDFNMDKQDFSDSMEFSSSYLGEGEEYESESLEVSGEKNEDDSEKKRSFLKHSKRGEFSDFQREGKMVKEHACKKKQESSGNNSQINHHHSSKSNEDEYENGHEMQDLQDINEGTAENLCNHSSREEVLPKRSESKREDLPESLNSNQASLPKDFNQEKDVDRLKLKDFSSIGAKRLKKVVSSMDKCNNEIDKIMKRVQRDLDKKSLREKKRTLSTKEEKFCIDEDKRHELRNVKTNENCCLLHQHGVIGLKTRNEESDKTTFDLRDHASRENHTENEEVIEKFEETELPIGRKHAYSQKEHHLCKNMCDVVLGVEEEFGPEEKNEVKKSTKSESALPLKFRFEDEVSKPVEKSEYETEMDALFAELRYCLTYGEMHSSESKEVEEDDAEDNQYVRCCKGKHQLFMDDEIGLKCLYCPHVELESKHVLPAWAERPYQGRGRSRYFGTEQQTCGIVGLNFTSGDSLTGLCNHGKGTVWDIKPAIRETMYEHQQEGFEFLWKNLAGTTDLSELNTSESSNVGGCIISHAPGTGKTRLTIVFIETYLKLFPNTRPVIIAPASMLLTWEEEFKKWEVEFPLHNLSNPEISGKEDKAAIQILPKGKCQEQNAVRMVKIFSWNKEPSVLCMSYNLFEQLAGEKEERDNWSRKRNRDIVEKESIPFRKILLEKPGLIILDEGHTPRNRRSNIWNALFKLQTKKRIILSGTPFQNNFEELFNLLRLVRPTVAEVLVKERKFTEMITSRGMHLRQKYKDDKGDQSAAVTETLNNAIEELKKAMAPFVHVHKGTILQQSLPGLRDCVILLNPPALQKSLIEKIKGSQNTFKFDHKVALISVHPYLLQHCSSTEKEKFGIDESALKASELNPNEGVKTRFLIELVRLSIARNEKVLIFSQYIQPLLLINVHLKRTFNWTDGKQLFKMEGKVEQKQRQSLINAFNNPKNEAKVLLASTKCCSEGINLVGASRVVLLDVVWNPSVERQAISRAYRLGQKKIVYTYHLMTSGTTEGEKYCRQAEKERLSELVFASSSNEKCKDSPNIIIEDDVLEDMVANVNLKDMFQKIVYQPKEKNLVETFTMSS